MIGMSRVPFTLHGGWISLPFFFQMGLYMISQLLFRHSLATYRFPLLLDKFFSDLELTYTPLIDRWTGELNGRKGLFPASYVEQL